jgi:hypothetical protein|tara:strand:+ start:4128 stop:4955 length:828 start_codon:yes stop_codon:yes gene_type:complete
MSILEVNKIRPQTGTTTEVGESGDTITVPSGATLNVAGTLGATSGANLTALNASNLGSGTLPSARFPATLPAVSAANLTNLPIVYPTISSLTPSVITNDATNVVIAGTNFTSIPHVEAISTTGAITPANSITFTSATSITANFTLPTDGTYYVRVENPNGLAVRTSSASLTVSDLPAWVTAAGTLGTFSGTAALSTITLTATNAVSFAVTTGSVTAGLTFNTGVGSATITGTQTAHTSAATDNFTVTATDAQGQTAARAFSITYSFGATGSGGFN